MNLKKFKGLERINFLVVSILGTVMHFIYNWSKQNKIVGIIAPVNESSFEHLKLLFFPWLLFLIVELFICLKSEIKIKCFEYVVPAKTVGVFAGMLAIIISFYTYSGVLGYSIDPINILTFFIGAAVQYFVTVGIYQKGKLSNKTDLIVSIIIIVFAIILFAVFTFNPPKIALFLDPVTKTYGINKNS